jgi:hypothetical protein
MVVNELLGMFVLHLWRFPATCCWAWELLWRHGYRLWPTGPEGGDQAYSPHLESCIMVVLCNSISKILGVSYLLWPWWQPQVALEIWSADIWTGRPLPPVVMKLLTDNTGGGWGMCCEVFLICLPLYFWANLTSFISAALQKGEGPT